jgi:hypothetical protein
VRKNENYEASLCKLVLARYDPTSRDEPYAYIDATCWQDEDTTIEDCLTLEKGTYIAYIEIDWFNDKKFNNFVFKTYTDNPVDLKVEDNNSHHDILENMLKSCARQKS